jgi:tripartite-type tricarboxylate transporter receptor subunit TctC
MRMTTCFATARAHRSIVHCTGSKREMARQTGAHVRVVAAGGNGDITAARIIAARLRDEFCQQFIIDNRPGAGAH